MQSLFFASKLFLGCTIFGPLRWRDWAEFLRTPTTLILKENIFRHMKRYYYHILLVRDKSKLLARYLVFYFKLSLYFQTPEALCKPHWRTLFVVESGHRRGCSHGRRTSTYQSFQLPKAIDLQTLPLLL